MERGGTTCGISKHENTKGLVSKDTVECQFLYELQGTAYLNSDVTAFLDDVMIEQCSYNWYLLPAVTLPPVKLQLTKLLFPPE